MRGADVAGTKLRPPLSPPGALSPSAWAAGGGGAAALALLAYSALGPGAAADVIQQRAQARVPAAEANVLLASEPMWTAVLSFAALSERLGAHEALGGALIVGAALFASSDS